MSYLKKAIGVAAVAAGIAFAAPAAAHGVVSGTTPIPVLGAGESQEFMITCPHHRYIVAGGYGAVEYPNDNPNRPGRASPIEVTASYPKTTRSWAVEVTNTSGRPTAGNEARVTLYVTCGYRH